MADKSILDMVLQTLKDEGIEEDKILKIEKSLRSKEWPLSRQICDCGCSLFFWRETNMECAVCRKSYNLIIKRRG